MYLAITILPAHAGMILPTDSDINATMHITRTCGDDPQSQFEQEPYRYILPAHAGMILYCVRFSFGIAYITRTCGDDPGWKKYAFIPKLYYPHMRGWSSLVQSFLWWILNITRTCGDDPHNMVIYPFCWKYYPHMRGWSWIAKWYRFIISILPAHAGMIPFPSGRLSMISYITRTCGDDPAIENMTFKTAKYYPHMRGWSSG